MPSTLTGLLLFVALLLPGFVFVMVVQRERPEHRPSALREAAAIALASVLSEIVVLSIFTGLDAMAPTWTPDVGRLIDEPAEYVAAHYGLVFAWAVALLIGACLVAGASAMLIRHLPVHPSAMSSWWTLFDQWQPGTTRHVQCLLDDGSYVAGELGDWNSWAEDSPDRDLILIAPITYRATGDECYKPHPVSTACISARNIVAMFVTYSDPATISSPSPAEAGAGVEGASEVAQ